MKDYSTKDYYQTNSPIPLIIIWVIVAYMFTWLDWDKILGVML